MVRLAVRRQMRGLFFWWLDLLFRCVVVLRRGPERPLLALRASNQAHARGMRLYRLSPLYFLMMAAVSLMSTSLSWPATMLTFFGYATRSNSGTPSGKSLTLRTVTQWSPT